MICCMMIADSNCMKYLQYYVIVTEYNDSRDERECFEKLTVRFLTNDFNYKFDRIDFR